jgi:hypothetical protein
VTHVACLTLTPGLIHRGPFRWRGRCWIEGICNLYGCNHQHSVFQLTLSHWKSALIKLLIIFTQYQTDRLIKENYAFFFDTKTYATPGSDPSAKTRIEIRVKFVAK